MYRKIENIVLAVLMRLMAICAVATVVYLGHEIWEMQQRTNKRMEVNGLDEQITKLQADIAGLQGKKERLESTAEPMPDADGKTPGK
jgi:TolA-binding protein